MNYGKFNKKDFIKQNYSINKILQNNIRIISEKIKQILLIITQKEKLLNYAIKNYRIAEKDFWNLYKNNLNKQNFIECKKKIRIKQIQCIIKKYTKYQNLVEYNYIKEKFQNNQELLKKTQRQNENEQYKEFFIEFKYQRKIIYRIIIVESTEYNEESLNHIFIEYI